MSVFPSVMPIMAIGDLGEWVGLSGSERVF